MTVLDLKRYKLNMSVIRNRFNSFMEKNPEISDSEFTDSVYLPLIGILVDFENAIDHAIDRAEVDF